MKHGKKYIESSKLVDTTKLYDVDEAMDLAVKTKKQAFRPAFCFNLAGDQGFEP